MDESRWIGVRSPEFRAISERIKVATRLSSKLSGYRWDEPGPVREVFEELIGKTVGDSFHLIPPFYADYGLNITIGRAVFIGYECMFTGHGAIDIADEVMIANKVNLVTAGHPVEPDKRRAYITVEPITLERNVWIGTAATVLPGVTVGADSVIAAGAVVTYNVPPATLVGRCAGDGHPASVTEQEPLNVQGRARERSEPWQRRASRSKRHAESKHRPPPFSRSCRIRNVTGISTGPTCSGEPSSTVPFPTWATPSP